MVSFEQVLFVLPLLGLTVSIFYYAIVIQNQNKTRKTQQYFEFLQSVSNPEFVERTEQFGDLSINSFEDYLSLSESDSVNFKNRSYLTWLNGVGKMLEDGLLDKELILHFGHEIRYMRTWRKIKPFVYEYRKTYGMNWHMTGLESLYNIMVKEWKDQGDPSKLPKNLIESN